MQYDRQEDGTLVPLPKKNIDTGHGPRAPRRASCRASRTNFETDILRAHRGRRPTEITGVAYGVGRPHATCRLRILADHARAVAFLIADGVLPSNEGRGYVLRRLLRRAVRHGRLLGVERPVPGAARRHGRSR